MPTDASASPFDHSPRVKLSGKKSDLAYFALKQAIMLREYQPGQQIREQTIAADFQCSQSTVREALIHLVKDGLVKRSGYQGTHITDTSVEEATALVHIRLSVERSLAAQLYRLKDADLTLFESLFKKMDESHEANDIFRCSELDREFHAQLAVVAGMEQLAPILKRCALHIHRYTLGNVEVPRDFIQEAGVGDEHRVLLQTLCEGTPELREAALSQHLASVLQRWAPLLYDAVGDEQFRGNTR